MSDKNVKRKAKAKFKGIKPKRLIRKSTQDWQSEFRDNSEREPTLYSRRSILVLEALEYYKNGTYEPSIVPKCSVRWGCSTRNARTIFAIAKRRFDKLWEGDLEDFRKKFLARFDYLYKKNLSIEDFKQAESVTVNQARLMGQYSEKVNVKVETEGALVEMLLDTIAKKNEAKSKETTDRPNSE